MGSPGAGVNGVLAAGRRTGGAEVGQTGNATGAPTDDREVASMIDDDGEGVLPPGWQIQVAPNGRKFFIDHSMREEHGDGVRIMLFRQQNHHLDRSAHDEAHAFAGEARERRRTALARG